MIATLATQAAADGHRRRRSSPATATRTSSCRDPHIKVLYNKRGVSDYALYDEAGIAERCRGVTPAQYPEYAALRGDTSDNLPGVPGIGEKTAAKLVTTYGNLEGIFEHLDELPPKQRQNLGEAQDRVFKNREMSQPRPRRRPRRRARRPRSMGAFDREQVRVLFDQLEFRTLLPRILDAVGDVGRRRPRPTRSRSRSRSPATRRPRLDALRARGEGATRVAIEAALGGRGRAQRGRAALAIATGDDAHVRRRAICSPTPTVRDGARRARRRRRAAARRAPRQGADARAATSTCASLDHDTAVMAYLLDPGRGEVPARRPRAALPLARADVARSRSRARSTSTATSSVEQTGRRAAVAAPARRRARRGARRARELVDLYERDRAPARPRARARWKTPGVRIDVEFLERARQGARRRVPARSRREIHAHAGEQFNVNSTPQLRAILFEKLGLTPVKKTKTGPSTDADSLQKMADEHPIVETLLRYREVEKLRSTYADALPPLVARRRPHPRDVQPARHHHRAASRASRRTCRTCRCAPPSGRELRKAFIADDGCGLLTADYSQIELRVLAHLAEDPGPDRRVRARRRRAHHHRGQGVRRRRGEGRRRSSAGSPRSSTTASRTAWRRTGSASGSTSRPTRPREILDAYFDAFPNVADVHEGDGPRGEGARLHHHALRPAPPAPRARRPTTSASARWASAWRRTRRCRAPRPTSSSSR